LALAVMLAITNTSGSGDREVVESRHIGTVALPSATGVALKGWIRPGCDRLVTIRDAAANNTYLTNHHEADNRRPRPTALRTSSPTP
jgi:hypothetical protein